MFLGNYINHKVSQAQTYSKKETTQKKEGDVTINYPSSSKKQVTTDKGEYVDFEEIKE
jgi:hypothetical protein